MLVFRCEENPGDFIIGQGAWRAGLAYIHDDEAETHLDGTRVNSMPCPREEPEGNPVHDYFKNNGYNHMHFGFESIQSYRNAFNSPKGREAMHKANGVLSVYEIDREFVLIGYAQVVFDHRKAKRVAVLKTTDDHYVA